MKSKILFLLLLLISASAYCQIKFEKGYYINNENERIEGMIKNYDWENNPIVIEFKSDENAVTVSKSINEVKEFEITGISKYVRSAVDIDRSATELSNLTVGRNPVWSKEVLFLKVIVEGKANLYQYDENNFHKFFYSVSDTSIQQLIYKMYLVVDEKGGNLDYNNDFRQQLWKDVRSENTDIKACESINYSKKELVTYFRKYNGISNANAVVTRDENKSRDLFFVNLMPGLSYSTLAGVQKYHGLTKTFSSDEFNFRIGLESGFVLPFNKNKWVFVIEPSYQYFKSRMEDIAIDFSSIDFPVGVRYNLFLTEKIKLFIDGYYISKAKLYLHRSLDINNNIGVGDNITSTDISTNYCFAFGTGLEYAKFSLGIRYYTHSQVFGDYLTNSTNYQRVAFIAGYQLFKIKHQ